MVLYQHDKDFSIMINGVDLMHSRRHQSELELARLGCSHLAQKKAPSILIGGLGMGYTLRQALDILPADANIVVAELITDVVEWNHAFLGHLNNYPLKDKRVELKTLDIVELISDCRNRFDAILLDVDNGPDAITDSGNNRLYNHSGLWSCQQALRKKGCLAIWSAKPCKPFEKIVQSCGFHVHCFRVPAHKGKNPPSHFIWIASESKAVIPSNSIF